MVAKNLKIMENYNLSICYHRPPPPIPPIAPAVTTLLQVLSPPLRRR